MGRTSHVVGAQADLDPGGEKLAYQRHASLPRRPIRAVLQQEVGLRQRDYGDLRPRDLIDQCVCTRRLQGRQSAEMTERHLAFQSTCDHRVDHHGGEHALGVQMLIEMQIDRQVAALGQVQQRIERARRVTAGIGARPQKIGLKLDCAFEAFYGIRVGKIVTRSRERDDVDIEPAGDIVACGKHPLHGPQPHDRVDVGVRAQPGHAMGNGTIEQPACSRTRIRAGESRACLRGCANCIRQGARAEGLHAEAAIGMSMQVDQTGKREPARLRPWRRLDRGDASLTQNESERARPQRQRDGLYFNSLAVQKLRSRSGARARGRNDISSPALHRSWGACAKTRSPARRAAP